MSKLFRTLFLTCTVYLSAFTAAQALQLIMVDSRRCQYCREFNREVAPHYNSMATGQMAPLRHVNGARRWPADLANVTPAYGTPTFILVDNGREVGRFAGYANPQIFWRTLDRLMSYAR
jgi:thioredoxin-related protein